MPIPEKSPKVWIVLVNWNGWRDAVECLESVLRLDYPDFGVIVCDNASSDGSIGKLRDWAAGTLAWTAPAGPLARLTTPPVPKPVACEHVRAPASFRHGDSAARLLLVETGGNLGFAGGNNVGIRIALDDPACAYVWLLNNDTVVEPGCLAAMVRRAGMDAETGITGSVNCFYADPGRVQALGGGHFSPWRVAIDLHGIGMRRGDIDAAAVQRAQARLDWVSGASMLVSRRFLQGVGEMEESYFLYFEEIDWALRARGRFRQALAEDAIVYHKAGSSTKEQHDSDFAIYTQYRSRFRMYRKLLPRLLVLCHVRTVRDMLVAALRGRKVASRAMLRAMRDDLS